VRHDQHRADGETLAQGNLDLLAAARRAHALLLHLEADAGEYYRETGWLGAAIKAAIPTTTAQESREVAEIVARALCRHREPDCWRTHMIDAADAITALEASGKWKIVPVEPTEEMLRGVPDWDRAVWQAMLLASPKVKG
jgi:hypothetical protein